LPEFEIGRRFLVGQIFQLIVMRFDSVKRFIHRMTREIFVPTRVEELVRAFRFSRDVCGQRCCAQQHQGERRRKN
jgi:hypothetical protein